MSHMEQVKQVIVDCAERCERVMRLESTYVRVGDFDSAAICADNALVDSNIAFRLAACL